MPLRQLQITDREFPAGEPDVQRTSFSLDAVGRFLCNTFDEATTNPDFDVVVVGSGMYGAYCAAKAYSESAVAGRTPLRVLVLEAGPFLVHEHSQNIPDLGLPNPFRPVINPFSPEAEKTRDLVWGLGWRGNTGFPGTAYCVGGKSIYWGGWCPRLRDADLVQWPAEVREYLTGPPRFGRNLPNRLSPPGSAVAPSSAPRATAPGVAPTSVYEAVEYEIGVKPADDFVFDPVDGDQGGTGAIGLNAALRARLEQAIAGLAVGGVQVDVPEPPPIAVQTQSFVSGVFSPDKFSSLTLLMAARRNASGTPDARARMFLVPNAHVTRLLVPRVTRDGAEAEGYRVSGIDVVVDGGRRTLPIGPDATVVLALGCIESTRLALESFPTAGRRGGDEIMGRNLMAHLRFDFPFDIDRQQFAAWVQQQTGMPLRDELQTASFHVQADSPDGRFHLQVYATGQSAGSAEGLLYRMIPDAEIARRLAAAQSPNTIRVVFRACGEMLGARQAPVHAAGTSWIDLASAADRDRLFDHARAFVHYEDQGANPIWQRMEATCRALAQAMGAIRLESVDRHEVGSTWHDSGTLFMGDDPAQSVTDTSGHFHHVGNAACVDQALFPTVGSANPVLTGLCLSRRVAETIVQRFVSEPEPTDEERAAERTAGFEDLLSTTNRGRWRPNDSRFTNVRPALITDGTIIEVHGDAGLGVLFYDDPQPFGDFELRLQWKAFREPGTGEPTANSGVFLRAPRPGATLDDATFYGRAIEVQIDDTGYDVASRRFESPLHRTGALYGQVPARLHASKAPSADGSPGFWNDYRIVAQDRRVTVALNGRIVADGVVPTELVQPGHLALQYHTGKVQFRAIRVRRL